MAKCGLCGSFRYIDKQNECSPFVTFPLREAVLVCSLSLIFGAGSFYWYVRQLRKSIICKFWGGGRIRYRRGCLPGREPAEEGFGGWLSNVPNVNMSTIGVGRDSVQGRFWRAQILDVIHHVLLLKRCNDLYEVMRHKNATHRHLQWYSCHLLRRVAVPSSTVSAISNP